MFNVVFLFGHFQMHHIFFVGTGLRTSVNKTKSAAFCRNSRLKSSCTSSTVNLTLEVIPM